MNDDCKNCGGPRSIHHYQTMQCPAGGREAPIGQKEEWMTLTFQPDTGDEIAELRSEVEELKKQVGSLRRELYRRTESKE